MSTLRRKQLQCNLSSGFDSNFLRRSDYGTANKNEARKYLRTYGLAPPGIDSYENQMKRCKFTFLASLK